MVSCGRRGGLYPVRYWTQASEPELDAIYLVVANIVVKDVFQRLGRVELVELEQLALQYSEEALHGCVVIAVALTGHAPDNPALMKALTERGHAGTATLGLNAGSVASLNRASWRPW